MMRLAPSVGRRRWFGADGCLLAIDEIGEDFEPAVRPIGDAILLGAHDALLSAVHEWTGVDHDWAPLDPPTEAALTHSVTGTDASLSSQTLGLVLTDAVLERVELVDAVVPAQLRVEPHAIASQLQLDQLTLTSGEAARVVPGSLMLLPASFAENWIATLECGPADSADATNASDVRRRASVFVQPATGMVYFRHWEEDEAETASESTDQSSSESASESASESGTASASESATASGAGSASESAVAEETASPANQTVPCKVYLHRGISLALDTWHEAEPADGTCAMTDGFRQPRLRVRIGDRELGATLMPLGDGYAALMSAPEWT